MQRLLHRMYVALPRLYGKASSGSSSPSHRGKYSLVFILFYLNLVRSVGTATFSRTILFKHLDFAFSLVTAELLVLVRLLDHPTSAYSMFQAFTMYQSITVIVRKMVSSTITRSSCARAGSLSALIGRRPSLHSTVSTHFMSLPFRGKLLCTTFTT
jgi:hypothetical protein